MTYYMLLCTERIDMGGSSVVVYASEKTVVMTSQSASLYCFFHSRYCLIELVFLQNFFEM
jgi:hypothetical protein